MGYAHFEASDLRQKTTKAQGQTDDLKLDTGKTRYWVARTTVDDGEPYNNRVTIERLEDDKWVTVDTYDGSSPEVP
jgi:hypothetical protein